MAEQLAAFKPFGVHEHLRELERMRRKMDSLWDSFFEGKTEKREEGSREWLPSVDLLETKDNIIVQAEVPGMEPKEIDILLSQDILTIKGEKKREREEEGEYYHFNERHYGVFTRSLRLPPYAENDKINASYKNGVLKITVPKSEEAKKKQVKIKVD